MGRIAIRAEQFSYSFSNTGADDHLPVGNAPVTGAVADETDQPGHCDGIPYQGIKPFIKVMGREIL